MSGLTKNYFSVLKQISDLFENEGIRWGLIASCNLVLHGLEVEPGDIDLYIDKESVPKANKLLEDYCEFPIVYRKDKNPKYRSYYGRFNIQGIQVEIMSELDILYRGEWCRQNYNFDLIIENTQYGFPIRQFPLEEEIELYRLRDKRNIAKLIQKYLYSKNLNNVT